MEFIWHDGGRATCGYVGTAGDCVTRSIAIATGEVYGDVYQSLGNLADRTARDGVADSIISRFLVQRGWSKTIARDAGSIQLPKGVVIVDFQPVGGSRAGHLSCVIDHTVYDTWNPFEDYEFRIVSYWTYDESRTGTTLPARAPGSRPVSERARLTQDEYDRILKRVRALHRTASNHASTEGEIRNALRAMQSLMLEHNLIRGDIVEDENNKVIGMTRRACPLNGKRVCQWESSLAHYLTKEIFPTVQYYISRKGHRTLYWFYGPVDDVQQTLGLFREMLMTIATAARLKYGGHARGSGASYAEGYVKGLPRREQATNRESATRDNALILARALAVHSSAVEWLQVECGVRLHYYTSYSGRYRFDHSAHQEGTRDGAKHQPPARDERKKLPHYRDNA